MGRTPRVPAELKHRPFSLEEARAAGLSFSSLRGKSWQRLGPRLYSWKGLSQDNWKLIDTFRRMLPPTATFVGRTAAWIHGIDVKPADPVQVSEMGLESRAGLDVWHIDVSDETEEIEGRRVTSLNRTLLDLCATLTQVEALVALDLACHANLIDIDALCLYADEARGRRGAARLRRLAGLAAAAESPMETRLRWLLIEAGLPSPEVQTDLYDDWGELIGRADLFYPQANLVIEFDGGNHRDRLVSDDRRQNSLHRAGFQILRFTTPDVYGRPSNVVALVTAALRPRRRPA